MAIGPLQWFLLECPRDPRESPRKHPREDPRERPRKRPRGRPRERPQGLPRKQPREYPRENSRENPSGRKGPLRLNPQWGAAAMKTWQLILLHQVQGRILADRQVKQNSDSTWPTAECRDVSWSTLGNPGNARGNTLGNTLGKALGNSLGNTRGTPHGSPSGTP